MASVLKIPGKKTKGIISFTTQERDRCIIGNPKIENQIKQLKKNWLFDFLIVYLYNCITK